MTYTIKMKNVQLNRRISLNFRDTALYAIFTNNVKFTRDLTAQIQQEMV